MKLWTHAICEVCYDLYREQNGWAESPPRVLWDAFGKDKEVWCCFCRDGIDDGWGTDGVIYVRFDPQKLNCSDFHFSEP